MEYQKRINLLDNTPYQPSKFKTKDWVEINYDSRGTFNAISQIKLKTTISKSSLCDYSDAYILVMGTIKIAKVQVARNYNARRAANTQMKGIKG